MAKPGIRTLRRAAALALTAAAAAAFIPAAFSARRPPASGAHLALQGVPPRGLSKTKPVPLVVVPRQRASAPRIGHEVQPGGRPRRLRRRVPEILKSYNDVAHSQGETASNPYPDMLFLGRDHKVTASENIDPNRVYMTGVSLGGTMAYRAGCILAGQAQPESRLSRRHGEPEVPAEQARLPLRRGRHRDSSAPYNGGSRLDVGDSEMALWQGFDRCTSTEKQTVRER